MLKVQYLHKHGCYSVVQLSGSSKTLTVSFEYTTAWIPSVTEDLKLLLCKWCLEDLRMQIADLFI